MENQSENQSENHLSSKIILAVLLIGAGIVLLANNFNIIPWDLQNAIFSWPMLLIVIGVFQLTRHPQKMIGLVLICIGCFFLIPKLFNVSIDFARLFWPAIFVGIGVLILFRRRSPHHRWDKEVINSADMIDEVNIFGGTERRMTTKSFKGGETVAIFGGSVYDFTDCDMAEGKNILEVVNIFGGSKFIIPSHWNVHVEVVSIFGGFSDKRKNVNISGDTKTKELYIKGVSIFGGGEIKSF